MNTTQKQLLNYSFYLLSRRRYTTAEITKKLSTKNSTKPFPATQAELQQIIDYLLQKKFLNDLEYIDLYLEGPAQRKMFGQNRILFALQQKGLSTEQIKTQIQAKNYPEAELAKKFLARQKPQAISDLKSKAKLYRKFLSRGFSTKTISKVLAI